MMVGTVLIIGDDHTEVVGTVIIIRLGMAVTIGIVLVIIPTTLITAIIMTETEKHRSKNHIRIRY